MTRMNKQLIRILLGVALFKLGLVAWGYLFAPGSLGNAWNHWDSNVYTTIASQWYAPTNIPPDYFGFLSHFPPLYPISIFLIGSFLSLSPQLAGILVSWVAIMMASYVFYQLILEETGQESIAIYAVIFLTVWPVSYFTIATYSESLSIFCIALSLYALRQRWFAWTAIAGAAAILTRLPSIAIAGAFTITLWQLYRRGDQLFPRAALFLVAGPTLALVAYMAINAHYYGDPLFFHYEYQTNPFSSKHAIIPFQETAQNLGILVKDFPSYSQEDFMATHGWNALFTLAAVVLVITGILMRIPSTYTAFSTISILLFASFSWGISNARYTLPILPLFFVLARLKPAIRLFILVLCLILLLYFTSIFVTGAWAF